VRAGARRSLRIHNPASSSSPAIGHTPIRLHELEAGDARFSKRRVDQGGADTGVSMAAFTVTRSGAACARRNRGDAERKGDALRDGVATELDDVVVHFGSSRVSKKSRVSTSGRVQWRSSVPRVGPRRVHRPGRSRCRGPRRRHVVGRSPPAADDRHGHRVEDAAHVHARETHLVPGLRRRDVVNGPDVVLEGATLDPRRAGRAVEVAQNIGGVERGARPVRSTRRCRRLRSPAARRGGGPR